MVRSYACLAALASTLVLCAGCASERSRAENTEQMLAAAGFEVHPADTPERQQQLAGLPPHRLLMRPAPPGSREPVGYVYADPDYCHCLYTGDMQAYQAFERLVVEKRIADERMQAAEMEQNAPFDWGVWGPGFWGPPVIIEHGGHHDHR